MPGPPKAGGLGTLCGRVASALEDFMPCTQARWLAVCAVLVACTATAPAGPLNPPSGPVTSTFKTLNDVRPGTPIHQSDLPLTITQPGSYYLAENLEFAPGAGFAAVAISLLPASESRAGSVTLDLSGFSIRWQGTSNPTPSSFGVYVSPVEGPQITIRNGQISGFGVGVQALNGVTLESMNLAYNGVFPNGGGVVIAGGTQTIVRACTFVRNSVGLRFDNDTGLNQYGGSSVDACVFNLNSNGLQADAGVAVRESTFSWNIFEALTVGSDNIVERCILQRNYANMPAAILVSGDRNRITGCTVENNQRGGIRVTGNNNTVEANSIVGNCTNESTVNGGLQVVGSASGNIIRGNTVKNNSNTGGTTRNYNFTSTSGNLYELLLCQLPETINVRARITLSGSLEMPAGSNASGLTIASDDVSVDLDGHSLVGSATSGNGIYVGGAFRGLRLANGTVRGFNAGIVIFDGAGAAGSMGVIEDVRVISNRREAIMGGETTQIRRCTVSQNGPAGVPVIVVGNDATIEACSVTNNTDTGPAIQSASGARIQNNVVDSNSGNGISSSFAGNIKGNTVRTNSEKGIVVGSSNLVESNTVQGNRLEGIEATTRNTITDNSVYANGLNPSASEANISVISNGNRIERNTVTNGDYGIRVTGGNNIVLSNRAWSNSTNYGIGPVNAYGPLVNVAGVSDISNTANANHPGANYSY